MRRWAPNRDWQDPDVEGTYFDKRRPVPARRMHHRTEGGGILLSDDADQRPMALCATPSSSERLEPSPRFILEKRVDFARDRRKRRSRGNGCSMTPTRYRECIETLGLSQHGLAPILRWSDRLTRS
jgi:hypothetical protein